MATHSQIDKQTKRQTSKQADTQIERQAHRQTKKEKVLYSNNSLWDRESGLQEERMLYSNGVACCVSIGGGVFG